MIVLINLLSSLINKHNAENVLSMLLRNMVTRLSNIVQSISIDIDDYGCLILDNNTNDLPYRSY